MPGEVDQYPAVIVAWLTDQLLQHLGDEEKWFKNPVGFNYLASNDPDYEPRFDAHLPAGWERLPMHEEVRVDG